jgi:hypothetical protein
MNSLHQKYIDQGETIYIGRVDSVMAFPGNERVKLTWMNNSDPRIDRTLIYWNDNKDSAEVKVNRTQSGIMELETIINIPEGACDLTVLNKDIAGNRSLSASKSVFVYGPKYISNLNNRNIRKFTFASGILTIDWVTVESELVQYTTISYTDYTDAFNPVQNTVRVENRDEQTIISGVQEGDKFSLNTTFLPEGGFDRVDALPMEYTLKAGVYEPSDPVSDYPYMWVINVDDFPDAYVLGYYQGMQRGGEYIYSTKFYAPADNTKVVFVPTQSLTDDRIGISPVTGNLINNKLTVQPLVLPQQGYYEIDIDLQNQMYNITPYTPTPPSYTGLVYIVGNIFGWGTDYPMTAIDDFRYTADYSITTNTTFKLIGDGWNPEWRPLLPAGEFTANESTVLGWRTGIPDNNVAFPFQGAGIYTFTFDKETLWCTISTKH